MFGFLRVDRCSHGAIDMLEMDVAWLSPCACTVKDGPLMPSGCVAVPLIRPVAASRLKPGGRALGPEGKAFVPKVKLSLPAHDAGIPVITGSATSGCPTFPCTQVPLGTPLDTHVKDSARLVALEQGGGGSSPPPPPPHDAVMAAAASMKIVRMQ